MAGQKPSFSFGSSGNKPAFQFKMPAAASGSTSTTGSAAPKPNFQFKPPGQSGATAPATAAGTKPAFAFAQAGKPAFSMPAASATAASSTATKPAFAFKALGGAASTSAAATATTTATAGSKPSFAFKPPASAASSTATSSTKPAFAFKTGGTASSSAGATSAASSSSSSATSSKFAFSANGTKAASTSSSKLFPSSSSSASSSSASSSLLGTAAAQPQQPAIDVTSRIKDMTVEEIVTMWNQDLEDHIRAFSTQALEVKRRDELLRENAKQIEEVQQSVQRVQMSTSTLDRFLETIKGNQKHLSDLLDEVEKQLQTMPTAQGKRTQDEMKREDAYRMAAEIDSELDQMNDTLKGVVTKLNRSAEQNLDPHNPLTQVVKILNIQMNSLQWIDRNSREVEQRLAVASKKLHAKENEQSSLMYRMRPGNDAV